MKILVTGGDSQIGNEFKNKKNLKHQFFFYSKF